MRKKHFTKIKYQFMIFKILHRVETKGSPFNPIRDIYEKPLANDTLNKEMLTPFPLRSRTKEGCLLSPYLFNIIL